MELFQGEQESMSNFYTSYLVSKQLWEAGIKLDDSAVWIHWIEDTDCYKLCTSHKEATYFLLCNKESEHELFQAYTAGQLLREFSKSNYPIDLHVRHDNYYHATIYKKADVGHLCENLVASTPEDALAQSNFMSALTF